MERADLQLYELIREKLLDYGLEYILEVNELEEEDVLFHLIRNGLLELPE